MLRDSVIFILHNIVHSVCEKVYPNFKAECLQRVLFLEYLFFVKLCSLLQFSEQTTFVETLSIVLIESY